MQTKRGVSLLEVVLAMGIMALAFSAVALLMASLVNLSTSFRFKRQAVFYAEQTLEQVKDIYVGSGYGGVYTLANPSSLATPVTTCYSDIFNKTIVSCAVTCLASGFNKFVSLNAQTLSQIRTTAVVTWTDRGSCQNTQVDTYYYQL